jgi:filamentous hemagglutinin family protein
MYKALKQFAWMQQSLLTSFTILACIPVNAQIIPDNTLGSQGSRIVPNTLIKGVSSDLINGGATRGSNLFHSFSQFNISDGQKVYFGNPSGVENILTRVTGGSASNILGTLGVNGTANLFLMNPNGILFGKNASLDVRGSFVGTTANAIQFGNQGIFSATNPQSAPLLTINPSALLFNQIQANAGITNLSQAPAGVNSVGQDVTGLRVPDGKNLLFVGGDINIDGGKLRAYGGQIGLTSLATPGIVELNDTFNLSVPNDIQRGNVSLTNEGEVNVRGSGGGNIAINAQNLNITGQSRVRAGIDVGLGTPQTKAGNIDINATGVMTLSNSTAISNILDTASVGKGGNLNITAGSLSLINGSVLNASNYGFGEAGNINLNIRDALTLKGVNQDDSRNFIVSNLDSGAVGKGGNINIQAGSVSLSDSSKFITSTYGQGDAGNISIQARDAVSLDSNAAIFNNVEAGGVGKGGDINITASSLSLKSGAQFQAGQRGTDTENNLAGGRGNAGAININTSDAVTLIGQKDGLATAIFTNVDKGAEGNGGSVNIKAASLSLSNQAFLNASTSGKGNAGNIFVQAADGISLENSYVFSTVDEDAAGDGGNITIDAGLISLTQGSELNSRTFGQGNAGNININARDTITFDGQEENNGIFSRAISAVIGEGVGKAGDIKITAGSLKLSNGAFISSGTLGQGDGGNITIDARDKITFDNGDASSIVGTGGVGKGGDISVTTGTLELLNGGKFNTNVAGKGNAGNVTINARDAVNIDGVLNGIFSVLITGGVGKGGDIQVTTGSLSATNGGLLAANSDGQGNSGNITINASDTITFAGRGINNEGLPSGANTTLANNGIGNGGEIRINARALSLKDGGQINANTFGQGNAGKIFIDTQHTISVDGLSDSDVPTAINTLGGTGNGGDIQLTTGTLSVTNGGRLSSFSQKNAGNITINARDTVNFDGTGRDGSSSSASSSLFQGVGKGGDIQITTGSLSVMNGAQLNASTSAQGNGGNIIIDARDNVIFDGSGSSKNGTGAYTTVASSGIGHAGNIKLTTGSLFLLNGGQMSATTLGKGDAGNIFINARNSIEGNGIGVNGRLSGAFSEVGEAASGKGGNIDVISGTLFLLNKALFDASTYGRGNAGNISVKVGDITLANTGQIRTTVESGGIGTAGDIDIKTRSLSLASGSQIVSVLFRPSRNQPAAQGQGGNIRIDASDVSLSGIGKTGFSSGLFTATDREASGKAGNITVTTNNLKIADAAQISAGTAGFGDGGDIIINANSLEALSGGQIATNTSSTSKAGTITLNIRDNLTLAGKDPNFSQRLTQVEERLRQPGETDKLTDVITNIGSTSGIFANTDVGSTGNGGSIFIDPAQIILRDGAKISVSSDGTGNAGNISIRGSNLTLDNGSSISAQTRSSEGGNIRLQLADFLLLRRGSQISTSAGTTQAGGDGGNINIDTPFIVAVSNDNSDITANAFSGKGGSVNISTQGIFGIAASPKLTNESDITASSELGVQGEITIKEPNIQPVQSLVELPNKVVDASNKFAQICPNAANAYRPLGQFIITGRGSLPPNPLQPLPGKQSFRQLATLDTSFTAAPTSSVPPTPSSPIEAQGIVKNANGEILLVAKGNEATPKAATTIATCPHQN